MSARRLSTSSAILPTERFGTLRITSAGPVNGATVRIGVGAVSVVVLESEDDKDDGNREVLEILVVTIGVVRWV